MMLLESERQQLLVDFNQTEAAYPDTALIHELFEAQVKANPKAIALVFEAHILTYQQLNQRANQLAHYLIERGVTPDSLVGLCVERSLEMVIGILGILKAGGAYVPLDPHNPEARLAYQIEDADLNIVLTQQTILAQLPVLAEQAVCLDSEGVLTQLALYSKRNPRVKKVGLHAHHLAYVIYTSGTTGQPKGVMVEHLSLIHI